MDSAWIGFVGVVLGSVLGGGAAIAASRSTNRASARAALNDRRITAYTAVIAAAGSVGLMAGNVRLLLSTESGMKASPLLSGRRTSSVIELINFLRGGIDGLFQATASVWACGTQEAIGTANDLLDHAVAVMGLGSETGTARTAFQSTIRGLAWSEQQDGALQEGISQLARLRREFSELARQETGMAVVSLWTHHDPANRATDPGSD